MLRVTFAYALAAYAVGQNDVVVADAGAGFATEAQQLRAGEILHDDAAILARDDVNGDTKQSLLNGTAFQVRIGEDFPILNFTKSKFTNEDLKAPEGFEPESDREHVPDKLPIEVVDDKFCSWREVHLNTIRDSAPPYPSRISFDFQSYLQYHSNE